MKKTIIYILSLLILINIVFAIEKGGILEQEKIKAYQGVNKTYTLKATYIAQDKVKFELNNESSKLLEREELYRFSDGSYIYVREILEEEVLEGPDRVSFKFWPALCGPDKCKEIIPEKINITEEVEEEINITEEIKEEIKPPEKEIEEIPPIKKTFLKKLIDWIKSWFK